MPLILVPTPIDEISPLEPTAFALLNEATPEDLILVEDLKPARRRWLSFGLPRESIARFYTFNEHHRQELLPEIQAALKNHKHVFLMSDGGLPCFCDPGVELVDFCHEKNIAVSCTPFPNSLMMALILSGFSCDQFVFSGFLSREANQRSIELTKLAQERRVQLLMETPYRLERLLEEFARHPELGQRRLFLALDLGHETQWLKRGKAAELLDEVRSKKAEFVLVLDKN